MAKVSADPENAQVDPTTEIVDASQQDPMTDTVLLVNGTSAIVPQGNGFIVRNTVRFAGQYILDNVECELQAGQFELVKKKPSSMTFGITCQEL